MKYRVRIGQKENTNLVREIEFFMDGNSPSDLMPVIQGFVKPEFLYRIDISEAPGMFIENPYENEPYDDYESSSEYLDEV